MTDIFGHGAAYFGYRTTELKIANDHTISENEFRAAVREAARDGKANRALIDLLARHFGVAKSTITILRGHSARQKIIELPT